MQGKKVLILNYYWPPSGGPSVQRWLTLSNEFHNMGIIPYILTVDETTATYPMIDESLLAEIDPKTKIIKTKTKELFWIYKKYFGRGIVPSAGFVNDHKPGPIKRLGRFVRGNFFIPDGRKSWNKSSVPAAIELIKKEGIEIIVSAGPPHSTHLAAMEIKSQIPSIKWVADFHDAWTDIWYYKKLLHTKLAAYIDASFEKKVLTQADLVLSVGNQLIEKLKSKVDSSHHPKFHLLSMGYDEKLFKEIESQELKDFEFPTILYTGTINSEYEPWGFFKALENIVKNHPEKQFTLKLVGKIEEGIINYLKNSNLDGSVHLIGYIPHHEAVEMMFRSKILFLCSPKTESEDIIIPGKLYEYMASGKAILNLGSKSSNTAKIIEETQSGRNFERTEILEMENFILENLFSENKTRYFGNIYEISKYGREKEAREISNLLKSL